MEEDRLKRVLRVDWYEENLLLYNLVRVLISPFFLQKPWNMQCSDYFFRFKVEKIWKESTPEKFGAEL